MKVIEQIANCMDFAEILDFLEDYRPRAIYFGLFFCIYPNGRMRVQLASEKVNITSCNLFLLLKIPVARNMKGVVIT